MKNSSVFQRRNIINVIVFVLFLCCFAGQKGKAQTDSLHVALDSLTFVGRKNTSVVKSVSSGSLEVDLKSIQGLPQILGNTDPVHFIKFLPGVQTTHEYDSGINIRGCGNSHNEISVQGVPIFGATHLLGLFSIFNPFHYSKMKYSPTSFSNRLGGSLEMELPDTLKERFTADISVGMISTQASAGVRLGKSSHLRASVRQSYLNLIYKPWLKVKDSSFGYGLGDYNLTYIYGGEKDRIWVDLYFGQDKASLAEQAYSVDFAVDWGNRMGAVHWEHDGEVVNQKHVAYCSSYYSEADVRQAQARAFLPSNITASGYMGKFSVGNMTYNADAVFYHVIPQVPELEGFHNAYKYEAEVQNSLEVSISADYDKKFGNNWLAKATLRGTFYHAFNYGSFWGLLPSVSISYNGHQYGKMTASYGWRQQNLFYTGLSSVGLPVEYWFAAGSYSPPQYAQWADLSYDLNLFQDMFEISGSLYFKRLYNQIEFSGDLFDLLYTVYDAESYLLRGNGFNVGLNLMLHKKSGKFTGWLSYSLGRALRRFDNPQYTGWYPANHERIHELNAVCSYKYRHWDFSGTFIYASGQPFTAPNSYYISSGQIVADFGEHNACRMSPYIRLDLSVNRSIIKNDKHENGINISIVNALARENDIMYKLFLNEDGTFVYTGQSFLLTVIPSISYYHKF